MPMTAIQDTMFVTASLNVRYRRPTPIDRPVEVRARIVGVAERRTVLECTLSSEGTICAEATVVAAWVGAGSAVHPQRVPPPAQTLGGWKADPPAPRPLAKTA